MAKEIKYYVIGGQYEAYNYGGTHTLAGAQRLATKNTEYWDNWQGWHKPRIFKAEDCERYTNFFGMNYYPKPYVEPCAVWDNYSKKWNSSVY